MINRRFVLKAGLAATLAGGGLSLIGCSKKTLSQWAGIVIATLEQELPYFTELLPSSVAVLSKAIQLAKDLKSALDAGSETTVELLNQLLAPNGLFQQLLNDAGLIPDESTRKIVSGILAIAGVALNVIATALSQGAAGAPNGVVARIRAKNVMGANTIEKAAQSDVLLRALQTLKK